MGEFKCKVDMFDKGRPATIPPRNMRNELSGVYARQELMTWRCQYRYTNEDIELMRSGDYKTARVSKEVGEMIMEKIIGLI